MDDGHREKRAKLEPPALANERFEAYYAAQGVCEDAGDFRAMMEAFRRPLPLTFRLNASTALVEAVRRKLEGDVLPALKREASMKPPKCVAWYPDRLSWQIDISQRRRGR